MATKVKSVIPMVNTAVRMVQTIQVYLHPTTEGVITESSSLKWETTMIVLILVVMDTYVMKTIERAEEEIQIKVTSKEFSLQSYKLLIKESILLSLHGGVDLIF